MTRRGFVCAAALATSVRSVAQPPLIVPVHRVMDAWAKCTPEQFRRFWWSIWPETVRDFDRSGIKLQCSDGKGEVRRSAGGRPVFIGLERGVINLVLTDHIPMYWDSGRALAGVTAMYDGYQLCMIALRYARGNEIPFLSVNTCTHELLHALLQDIFVSRPTRLQSDEREFRIDWYGTRLWLFRNGSAVRKSAEVYLDRLRSAEAARTLLDSPARR